MQLYRIALTTATLSLNNINKENLNKLQKCQNAAAKVIVSPSHSSAVERLKELHWLPIESRVVYKILMIVFKILHGQCTTLKLHFKISNLCSGSSYQVETNLKPSMVKEYLSIVVVDIGMY